MTLNVNLAVSGYDLQQAFLDKTTALPLAGGLVYFYQDLNRNNLKTVYELGGSPPNYTLVALPNPITLSNAGTIMDASGNDVQLYYYPYDANGDPDNYYVAVYAAPPQPPPPPFPPVGTPEFTRENVPGVTATTGPNVTGPQSTENALTNPQFVDVYFNPAVGMTIMYGSGITDTPIAPGWQLQITASNSGSLSVNRTSISGASAHVTNPPYALTIGTGANVTRVILYQRLYNNPDIWSFTNNILNSGGFIATSLTLANPAGVVNMFYAPSGSVPAENILSASNTGGVWQTFNQTTQLALAINPNTSDTGYVDIQIDLTNSGQVTLTSVQVLGLEEPIGNVPFDQEPVNRQKDHTFNVFQPLINYKPTPSYLVGWDFPLNPTQPFGPTRSTQASGANTGFYCWDETIVFQTVTSSVSVSRAANGGLMLTCVVGGQVALIQYREQTIARKILSDRASVRISGSTTHAGGLTGNVTLWATTDGSLPNVADGTNLTLITTLGANGIPSALSSGNWVQVPNVYQNTSFTLGAASITNSESADIILNGWDMANVAPTNTATFFAIVVGFSAWVNPDTITFNSTSLCPGDIPSRPAPKSYAETLLTCQPYFWSTFPDGSAPAAAAGISTGYLMWQIDNSAGGNVLCEPYPVSMRATPNVSFYNPITAANFKARDFTSGTDCTVTTTAVGSPASNPTNKVLYVNAGGASGAAQFDNLGVHVTSDARLGIV